MATRYPASRRPRARTTTALCLMVASLLAFAAPARADAPHVPGQVMVQFERGTALEEQRTLAQRIAGGLAPQGEVGLARTSVVETDPGQSVAEAVRQLRAAGRVEYAGPDYLLESQDLLPLDPLFGDKQWALREIQAPAAWDISTGDPATKVAVLDTGVASHPDLNPNLWINHAEYDGGRSTNGIDDDRNGYVDDWGGWNSYKQNGTWQDTLGAHGTGVSGIVAAVGNNGKGGSGVAWKASIVPIQADNLPAGRGGYPSSSVIRAINYAAHGAKAKVISMSIGSYTADPLMSQAITNASNSLIVAAAGNDGKDVDVEPSYPCSYPQSNVICVGATDQDSRLAIWDATHTSNYGDQNIDLAAPGKDILTTGIFNRYTMMWGTSSATPMVSGVAALLYSRMPTATPSQIRNMILSSVDPKPALAGKVATGGRLNAYRALSLTR
jgi:thermitase